MHSYRLKDSESTPEELAQQAAEWLVRLSADDMAPSVRVAVQDEFEKWKQANPKHAQSARKMELIIQQTSQLRDTTSHTAHPVPARMAIEAVFREKRKYEWVKKNVITLILVMALAIPFWVAEQHYPLTYMLAEMRTTTGEWETYSLAHNNRITLNSLSAVNYPFNDNDRQLELVRGEVLVDVVTNPEYPFLVVTKHGKIYALGTRFIVSLDEENTTLTMLESSASIQTLDHGKKNTDKLIISAGQRVSMSIQGIGEVEEIDEHAFSDAWKFRHLVVENQSLPEVLDELARHHAGFFHYDRVALEEKRVSAVLPLDDTEKALQLLARSFSLRITTYTPWLTIVEEIDGKKVKAM